MLREVAGGMGLPALISWGVKMGTRVGLVALESAFVAAKDLDPDVTVEIRALATSKKLKFQGEVKIGAEEYVVADAAGKVKTFGDVDDLVKTVSAVMPTSSGDYVVSVVTGALLVKSLPADLVKAAEADIVKLNAAKTKAQATVTALDTQLALMDGWETGNVLQVARKAEVTTQKATVNAEIAAIDDEVTRLTALVTP